MTDGWFDQSEIVTVSLFEEPYLQAGCHAVADHIESEETNISGSRCNSRAIFEIGQAIGSRETLAFSDYFLRRNSYTRGALFQRPTPDPVFRERETV